MLEVRNVSVSYGRHRALEGVSATVGKGEICVILGANGAGKSTLLKAIAGMVRTEHGSDVLMNGTRITAMKPHRIVEQGIALVPEGRGIFGDLTVAENLQLGAFAGRARREEAATLDFIYGLFPRLAERRRQVARTMSGGEQQMVAIGRALMSKPEILMLDEPSLGLSPILTQELFRTLRKIADAGLGILLVEQNARQSLKIAGRGYLIENGVVKGENSAAALMRDPAVISTYLGGRTAAPKAAHATVALPPPMRLPIELGSMGAMVFDLAARAGRIQAAFVRALRQGGELPSAFVGRYDPKMAGDPWSQLQAPARGEPPRPKASEEAKRVADLAAMMAGRGAERLALHVRTSRLSSPQPSAFLRSFDATTVPPDAAPQPPLSHVGTSIEAADPHPQREPDHFVQLAARAAERSTAFVRSLRQSLPQPSAFSDFSAAPSPVAPPAAEKPRTPGVGSFSLIGHNSGGMGLDDTPEAEGSAAAAVPSMRDLAAHAASIHAAHVAERRRHLTAFLIPAAAKPAAGETGSDRQENTASKAG